MLMPDPLDSDGPRVHATHCRREVVDSCQPPTVYPISVAGDCRENSVFVFISFNQVVLYGRGRPV